MQLILRIFVHMIHIFFFISAFNIPHLDKKPLQEVVRPARGALARVIILNSITSSNKDGIRVVDD